MSAEPEFVEAHEESLLPLVARLSADPPRFFIKSGRVGGPDSERGSLAITSADREGALAAVKSPDAEWELDPDLEVELLVSGADGVDEGLLIPRFLYRRADRIYEYAAAMPEVKRRFRELIAR